MPLDSHHLFCCMRQSTSSNSRNNNNFNPYGWKCAVVSTFYSRNLCCFFSSQNERAVLCIRDGDLLISFIPEFHISPPTHFEEPLWRGHPNFCLLFWLSLTDDLSRTFCRIRDEASSGVFSFFARLPVGSTSRGYNLMTINDGEQYKMFSTRRFHE